MTDISKLQTMGKFSGVDNVNDATRLSPMIVGQEYVYPLQQANNLLIDNAFSLSSRPGYESVLSGSDIHSLWSDNVTCLFVDTATLKQLKTNYATVSLRIGLTRGARMSYAPVNDRVYYANGYEIGYVSNFLSNLLTDPEREFKMPLPAGQLIEYYRGCLYVADGPILYISDPLCDYFDVRTGYKYFSSDIRLIRAVDDGLYVGDTSVWWLNGKSGDEFTRDLAYSSRPIPYTDTRIDGQYVGSGLKGNIAIWTGENGICVGDNSGQVTNLTEARYTFTPTGRGTAFVRDNNNIRHYINSLY